MMIKRFISLILALVLIFSFGISAFAEWSYADSSNLATIAGNYGYASSSVVGYLSSIFSLLNSKLISTTLQIEQGLTNLHSDNVYIRSDLSAINSAIGNYSTSGSIRYYLSNMWSDLNDIRDVVADEDDIQAKEASRNNQQSFTSEFLTGDNSVSTSDIGALSGLGSSFKDFFSMDGAGGGSASVDISSWSEILIDDEPFTFFTEADSIADSMGVEAGGFIPNPDVGGGGGDTPDIPDTPPDEDEFPNDGNVYLRCLGLENVYGSSYPSISRLGKITEEFTVLSPGDVIELSLGIHKNYAYYVSINGVFIGYEDSNMSILEPYFTNNITLEFFKVPYGSGVKAQYIYLTYRSSSSSSSPLQAPMRMMMSYDTSNDVVTHYYDDNMNKLFGFLRGD